MYCDRWAETVGFYQALGLNVLERNDWFVEFELNDRARLSVANAGRTSLNSAKGAGLTLTFQVADIAASFAQIEQVGIASEGIKEHAWGARVFYVFDPEGNRIEYWSTQ